MVSEMVSHVEMPGSNPRSILQLNITVFGNKKTLSTKPRAVKKAQGAKKKQLLMRLKIKNTIHEFANEF